MSHTPEDVITKLGQLEPDELARLFRDEGVVGMPRRSDACPVSVYCLSSTFRDIRITKDAWFDENDLMDGQHSLPPTVREFVARFDRGIYPGLISD